MEKEFQEWRANVAEIEHGMKFVSIQSYFLKIVISFLILRMP